LSSLGFDGALPPILGTVVGLYVATIYFSSPVSFGGMSSSSMPDFSSYFGKGAAPVVTASTMPLPPEPEPSTTTTTLAPTDAAASTTLVMRPGGPCASQCCSDFDCQSYSGIHLFRCISNLCEVRSCDYDGDCATAGFICQLNVCTAE
jgi:hypothetical protein